MSDERHDRIVAAALEVFGRYGYRRTSMDQIAQAARISRPAVYQHIGGKEAVFREVARRVADDVIAAASAAAARPGGVADRLAGALGQKLDLYGPVLDAGFRAELFAEAGEVAADIIADSNERYTAVVEKILAESASALPRLGAAISPREVALVLIDTLPGLAQEPDVAAARTRLHQLVDLVVAGLS